MTLPITGGIPPELLLSALGRSPRAQAIGGLGNITEKILALQARRKLLSGLDPESQTYAQLGAPVGDIFKEKQHILRQREELESRAKEALLRENAANEARQEKAQQAKEIEALKGTLKKEIESIRSEAKKNAPAPASREDAGAKIAKNIVEKRYKSNEPFTEDDKELLEPFGYKFQSIGKSFPLWGKDRYNLIDLPKNQQSVGIAPKARRLKVQLPNGRIAIVNETDEAIPGAKYIGEAP